MECGQPDFVHTFENINERLAARSRAIALNYTNKSDCMAGYFEPLEIKLKSFNQILLSK